MSSENLSRSDTTAGGIGKRLVSLRKALGLKQAEFAERLSMTPQQLIRYEKGRVVPDPLILIRLKEITQATIDWILVGGPETPQPLQLNPLARRVQLDLRDVTDDESAVLFPLVRALIELRRASDDTFEQVLSHTRTLAHLSALDLAPIEKAIAEFDRSISKTPHPVRARRKNQ